MKYAFPRLVVVTTLTPTLCHYNCAGNTGDYPEETCGVFNAKREFSDSEDVHAYKRLPQCIDMARVPYTPKLPKVGDKLRFVHTKEEHAVAEVRVLPGGQDDWEVRLDPPLSGSYMGWVWITERYFK